MQLNSARFSLIQLPSIVIRSFGLAILIGMTSVAGGDEGQTETRGTDEIKNRFATLVSKVSIAPYGKPQSLFKLQSRPALSWSNPARQTTAGALFLWTSAGRPQVALCAYPSGEQVIDLEFQSLSDGPLSADSEDRLLWQPGEAGVTWSAIDAVQPPARSAPSRLRQMRIIARQFSAKLVPPQKNPIELRLLETPVYRYEISEDDATHNNSTAQSNSGNSADGLIDGAIFAFVQGTDPEVLLMVEAYQENSQQKWRYALARMSIVPTQVSRQSNLVWETQWAISRSDTPYYVYKSF
ncbi:MAG: hypothetical protein KDB00_01845 [Planctomycetales bacterium]|nr:hypothetical protein [Planctomycetales bacterium]